MNSEFHDTDRVFISHGHNEIICLKLKEFVRARLNMVPVVLKDEPDLGMTIVEKLEHYGSDCSFALIVLTADDLTVEGGKRARQNVIHELGFFHGKLGRKRVLLLLQKGVELFSNISGLIYKEFEENNVQAIFEDIRMALESGDASGHGQEIPDDYCTAIVVVSSSSSTPRSLALIGRGGECWLKLSEGEPVELTFNEPAQITYGTSAGGNDRFFFIAKKGDKLSNVTGATIRPMLHVELKFGNLDALKRYEIEYHSGRSRVDGSWETCLRDHNHGDRPLNALCNK